MEKIKCVAVVLAAGSGKRMQSDVAKQYLLLNDKPVLWYSLHAFEESSIIDEVILVVGKDEIPYCRQEIVEKYDFHKVMNVIEGGAERYLSVWEALKVIKGDWRGNAETCCSMNAVPIFENTAEEHKEIIFIHDGARPFVTEDILRDTYEAACEYGACVTGMPVKDTIKISDKDGFAVQTPKRKNVWQVQTPQVFDAELIIDSYSKLMEQLEAVKNAGIEITDDAMVVETMTNKCIKLVQGSYKNMKITTPEDMKIAKSLL